MGLTIIGPSMFLHQNPYFYLIPEMYEEEHASLIVSLLADLPVWTGGSGLMTALTEKLLAESSIRKKQNLRDQTSGAVTQRLHFRTFFLGSSIAPGVPVLIPVGNPDIRIVLKSGNFGQTDFFTRALAMTGG